MKIARIEPFCVSPRWIFVRVETDTGLVGWGESILPRRVNAVLGAIADLAENIIGQDPFRIEELWQKMYRGGFFRGGPVLATAAAGIEHALWDIKGRHLNVPVYELLGGRVRDNVRAYAWIAGDRPGQEVEHARERVKQGFTAVKMNATAELNFLDHWSQIDAVVRRVAAIREAFPDLGIAVDFHGRVHRPMTKQLIHALEPFKLAWIEESLLAEHDDILPSVVGATSIPIATGERLYNRWDFKEVLRGGVVDVVQPDVSMTGLFELEKISRMAEAYDIAVAPHCPNGPISLAATLQVDGCVTNIAMQEYSVGIHYHSGYAGLRPGEMHDYLVDPSVLTIKDGALLIPSGPGLGITVNETVVRERNKIWSFRDNNWRNADGTLAEW